MLTIAFPLCPQAAQAPDDVHHVRPRRPVQALRRQGHEPGPHPRRAPRQSRPHSPLPDSSPSSQADSSHARSSPAAAVRKLGLTDADFDTVAVTLAETLREFKLTEAQVKQAMDIVGSTREQARAQRSACLTLPAARMVVTTVTEELLTACAPPPVSQVMGRAA